MTLPELTADRAIYKSCRCYLSSGTSVTMHGVSPSLGELPSGTYRQTCYDCYVYYEDFFATPILQCSCPDFNGNPQSTGLKYPSTCSGVDIANCNGRLTCGAC